MTGGTLMVMTESEVSQFVARQYRMAVDGCELAEAKHYLQPEKLFREARAELQESRVATTGPRAREWRDKTFQKLHELLQLVQRQRTTNA